MSGEDLKAGDTVILKSGSPAMTIRRVAVFNGAQMAECDWFDGKKQLSARFTLAQLEKWAGPRV